MIKNKKMLMTLSFCVGAVMLATTAFADITTKTGYDQLKDSLKYTAESMIETSQSYTMQATISMKDNGALFASSSNISKSDNVKKQTESTSTTVGSDGKTTESYTYSDETAFISHNSDNDTYYVTERSGKDTSRLSQNPFKQPTAKDAEKIADALIGNLKDYIIVDNKSDGSKELSGSLSEAQIPALINAVASFGFKQTFSQRSYPGSTFESFPQLVDDIFIKNAKANININKSGIIENVLASSTLSGKDKDGKMHDITLELLFRVTDINSTTITKPDLTGKKVEKSIQMNKDNAKIPATFIGKYKNNIVILKDDKFIKVGERFVEISEIKDDHIIGKYYEVYKAEYASQYTKNDLVFDAETKNPYNGEFTITNSEGKKVSGNISWSMQGGNIYFYTNQQNMSYDGNFSRVFDE